MPESAATSRVRGRWRIERVASIDSTNRFLMDAARSGAPDGLVVVADHQTAGRGRRGRRWEAAPGSALLASVLVRPDLTPTRCGLVTAAAGVALAGALSDVGGITAGLKWPNDLVVGDRKLAGILTEADVAGGTVRALVIGVGVNLRSHAVPPELVTDATSCEALSARPVGRDDLLDAFLDRLGPYLEDLDAALGEARRRSATVGRRVQVDLGGGRALHGTATALHDTGALVVRDDTGTEVVVSVGDVVHLRPEMRG